MLEYEPRRSRRPAQNSKHRTPGQRQGAARHGPLPKEEGWARGNRTRNPGRAVIKQLRIQPGSSDERSAPAGHEEPVDAGTVEALPRRRYSDQPPQARSHRLEVD